MPKLKVLLKTFLLFSPHVVTRAQACKFKDAVDLSQTFFGNDPVFENIPVQSDMVTSEDSATSDIEVGHEDKMSEGDCDLLIPFGRLPLAAAQRTDSSLSMYFSVSSDPDVYAPDQLHGPGERLGGWNSPSPVCHTYHGAGVPWF